MTVFVCIDDTMGMAFNGRRQSRDSAVVEDILRSCGGVPQMDGRSEKLFGEGGGNTSSASLHSAPSPYPLCRVATSPPDRGSRPQGEGLDSRALPISTQRCGCVQRRRF